MLLRRGECRVILDLFAGPGGWDAAAADHSARVVGLEWDAAACATATAAGHARIRCDVAAYPTEPFAGITGLIASPPCQAWSMAGKRKGEADRAHCHDLADRMAQGDDSTDWTEWEDPRSPLVCQPIRWARDLRPEWIALEEVPAVASLWEHFARILRGWGYSVWTGDLCAADYGVPQTRTRRILMASRSTTVQPPAPTHAEHPQGADLFDTEMSGWVSMATALGWQPGWVGFPRRGDLPGEEYRARDITEKTRSWKRYPAAMGDVRSKNGCVRPTAAPAPTLTASMDNGNFQWVYDRPATTVVGSFCPDVIAAPGYRTKTSRQDAPGSVSVSEAGILQSFPADYPWRGSRSKQFQQVGNAIPPRLAAHVLTALVAP